MADELLHAWYVNELLGVLFFWERRVGKVAGYLWDGQYQLAAQMGEPFQVLVEPDTMV